MDRRTTTARASLADGDRGTDTRLDAGVPAVGTATPRSGGVRVLVTVQHPAHVHFYRNVIEELRADGHSVRVCARDKDVAVDLLEAYDVDHAVLAGTGESVVERALVQGRYELRLLERARRFDPDVITGIGGVAAAHVATLVGARSVVFTDSEPATLTNWLTFPFADVVCTPEWYDGTVRSGHVTYPGLHELAYLGPDRFEPDPRVLREAGVDPTETYSVVRFVSWGAQHDVGEHGLSPDIRRRLVEALADHGAVYVTAEDRLPPGLEAYRLPVAPADLHHLLAFADCYVGDSQTVATEAALLGTPAVRCNSFAGEDDMANFRLLSEHDLVYSTTDEERAIELATDLVATADADWEERRDALLAASVDVTAFVRDLLLAAGRSTTGVRLGEVVPDPGQPADGAATPDDGASEGRSKFDDGNDGACADADRTGACADDAPPAQGGNGDAGSSGGTDRDATRGEPRDVDVEGTDGHAAEPAGRRP